MELYNLDQITKKEIAASLGEVLGKHFVNVKGEEISFDEKEIKTARKEDLARMLRDAIYDIVGIKEGDAIVPVDDPDLIGEGGEEGKYVDAARLSNETLHRFNLIIKEPEGGNGGGSDSEPEKVKVKEQEVKVEDKNTKKVEQEEKKAKLAAEKAEKKKAAEEAKAAKKEAKKQAREQARQEKEAVKEDKKEEKGARKKRAGGEMNRMQSVLLAIAELGVFATLEEIAIASDRIYLAANPHRFSNLKEPEGIAKWVVVALLATNFLRTEGGQYIVQGTLSDEILALKK